MAEQMSSSMPQSVLKQIHKWRLEKLSYKDIVSRLRCRTVPSGYTIHTWIPGMKLVVLHEIIIFTTGKEDDADKLRSILTRWEYTYQICQWHDNGLEFRYYAYVPEVTKREFHEREDDTHIFKV